MLRLRELDLSLVGLNNVLPLLDTGEAFLLVNTVLLPTRIKLDIPKITPDSATGISGATGAGSSPTTGAIAAAIQFVRSQSRS